MTTHATTIGTAYEAKYHTRDTVPAEEIQRGLMRSDACTRIVMDHFKKNPFDKINASRFVELYGQFTVHEYRSRLTECGDTKKNAGHLHRLPERVKSITGGYEHLYEIAYIPVGVQLQMFASN